jgi:hypothetical protein
MIHTVHDRGASLSGRGQWVSTLQNFVGSNRSKSSNGSRHFERIERLERFEPNSDEAYSSICSL